MFLPLLAPQTVSIRPISIQPPSLQPPTLKPAPTIGFAPVALAGGKTVTATAIVSIPAGYHAYQNPPKSQFENPLKLSVGKTAFKVGGFTYPKGVAKKVAGSDSLVYEGNVKIAFRITAPKGMKPGTARIPLKLDYQLCSDTTCLPPDALNLTLAAKVKKR